MKQWAQQGMTLGSCFNPRAVGDTSKKVGVAASPLKDDEIICRVNLVDKQPVGSEMAFPTALPVASEPVVLEFRPQALPPQESGYHRFNFVRS
jgi:hypothetical protein